MMKRNESAEPVIVSGFQNGVPPLGICLAFCLAGLLLFGCVWHTGPGGWQRTDIGPFNLGLLFFGTLFECVGGLFFKWRRDVLRLESEETVCRKFGVDKAALQRLIEDRGIRPRYVVNGQSLYDLADFREANMLLRASAAPNAPPETLLRPASVNVETPPETLLRAAVSTQDDMRRE